MENENRILPPQGYPLFGFMPEGTRKAGLSEAKVRKCPVDLSPNVSKKPLVGATIGRPQIL